MGRPVRETTSLVPLDADAEARGVAVVREMSDASDAMREIEGNYAAERDLANQLIGRVQAARAIAEFSLTVGTSQLAHVKENKLYRAIRGQKSPDGREFSGTWQEFCQSVGVSLTKADEDIQNYHAFGEAALDSMRTVGLTYQQLRALRRLPDDDRSALAAVAGDHDSLLDLAEQLIARQAAEKAAAAERIAAAEEDKAAIVRVLADKSAQLDRAQTDLEKAQAKLRGESQQPPDAVRAELAGEVMRCAAHAQMALSAHLYHAIEALRAHEERHLFETGHPEDSSNLLAGALGQVAAAVDHLRHLYNVPLEPTGRYPMAQVWDALDADAQLTPEARAAAEQDKADAIIDMARDGGHSDADIAKMHKAAWAASRYGQAAAVEPQPQPAPAVGRRRTAPPPPLAVVKGDGLDAFFDHDPDAK